MARELDQSCHADSAKPGTGIGPKADTGIEPKVGTGIGPKGDTGIGPKAGTGIRRKPAPANLPSVWQRRALNRRR